MKWELILKEIRLREGVFEELNERYLKMLMGIVELHNQEGPVEKSQLKKLLVDDDMEHLL
jgi:hypothetical protein